MAKAAGHVLFSGIIVVDWKPYAGGALMEMESQARNRRDVWMIMLLPASIPIRSEQMYTVMVELFIRIH